MNMEEYVTLALQNCMNTMIDCLYYYHMTEGRPELADFGSSPFLCVNSLSVY